MCRSWPVGTDLCRWLATDSGFHCKRFIDAYPIIIPSRAGVLLYRAPSSNNLSIIYKRYCHFQLQWSVKQEIYQCRKLLFHVYVDRTVRYDWTRSIYCTLFNMLPEVSPYLSQKVSNLTHCMISVFRCRVNDILALLGFHA